MGSANPRSFSRGKRGIAGTLVFVMFDHDALLSGLQEHIEANKVFYNRPLLSSGRSVNNEALSIEDWDRQMNAIANSGSSGSTTTEDAARRTRAITQQQTPVIADEIPPFDITVSMANEYGKAAVMVLYGVEILNQGSQFSIDNIQSQMACTFAARRLKTLEAVDLAA